MREATSRVADGTAKVAGGVVGAAVAGVIGGIQGTAESAMAGATVVSRWPASRVRHGSVVPSAVSREPPREYASGGAQAVNPDGRGVDVGIARGGPQTAARPSDGCARRDSACLPGLVEALAHNLPCLA